MVYHIYEGTLVKGSQIKKDTIVGGIVMGSLKLTNVAGYDVIVKKGKFLSEETSLWLVKDGKEFEFSVPSLEYENDDHEFMLKKSVPTQLEDVVVEAAEAISGEREQVGYFEKITLKGELKDALVDWLN